MIGCCSFSLFALLSACFQFVFLSNFSHASPQQQARDARKRDALRIDGFDLTVITSSQFHHVTQCTALLLGVGRRVGPRKRKLSAEHVPRHLTLRKQVRAHHREHFPFLFKKSRS